MNIEAPRVARSARPGQFVIVRLDEHGERVPLTISDYDAEQGWVTIVTQTVGYSTSKLCAMSEGDSLADFAGPLGCPSEFVHEEPEALRRRRILFVAGGRRDRSGLSAGQVAVGARREGRRHHRGEEQGYADPYR